MSTLQLAPVDTRLLKAWTCLKADGVGASVSSTTLTKLKSFTIPGGTMGPNGRLRISHMWNKSAATTPNASVEIHFGGATLSTILITTNLSFNARHTIANRNNQASQICGMLSSNPNSFGQVGTGALPTLAVDTSLNQDVEFWAKINSAGTMTFTLEAFRIDCLYGA